MFALGVPEAPGDWQILGAICVVHLFSSRELELMEWIKRAKQL
jgi:hypothetical protein